MQAATLNLPAECVVYAKVMGSSLAYHIILQVLLSISVIIHFTNNITSFSIVLLNIEKY